MLHQVRSQDCLKTSYGIQLCSHGLEQNFHSRSRDGVLVPVSPTRWNARVGRYRGLKGPKTHKEFWIVGLGGLCGYWSTPGFEADKPDFDAARPGF